MNDSVLIRRYRNRKYYNVTTKRYTNLTDINQLVRDGIPFKVTFLGLDVTSDTAFDAAAVDLRGNLDNQVLKTLISQLGGSGVQNNPT